MASKQLSAGTADLEGSPDEKTGVSHSEHSRVGLSIEDIEFLDSFLEHRKNSILRKVDVGLTPLHFVALYSRVPVAVDPHACTVVLDCLPRQDEYR